MSKVTQNIEGSNISGRFSRKAIISVMLGVFSIIIFFAFPRSNEFWFKLSHSLTLVLLFTLTALMIVTGFSAFLLSINAIKLIRLDQVQSRGLQIAYAGRMLGIIGCVFGLLMVFTSPGFIEADLQSRISHDKALLRKLRVAIESYCIDWGRYPKDLKYLLNPINIYDKKLNRSVWRPYVKELPFSSFGKFQGARYYVGESGYNHYFVWMPGPDNDFDIVVNSKFIYSYNTISEQVIKDDSIIPTLWLVERYFDPTNGITSNGDLVYHKNGNIQRRNRMR